MFGFTFGGDKVDSRGVELILNVWIFSSTIDFASRIDSNLKLEFEVFASTIDF
jgi:hypothetical protein